MADGFPIPGSVMAVSWSWCAACDRQVVSAFVRRDPTAGTSELVALCHGQEDRRLLSAEEIEDARAGDRVVVFAPA